MNHNIQNSEFAFKVNSLLNEGRLFEAFPLLSARLRDNNMRRLSEYVDRLGTNYSYMLDFASSGGDDPGRDLLVSDTTADLRSILDILLCFERYINSSNEFYATMRLDRLQSIPLSEMLADYRKVESELSLALESDADPGHLASRKDELISHIFDKVMVLPYLATEELKYLSETCCAEDTPFELSAMIVSAIFLGMTVNYSRYRLMTLLDIAENAMDEKIRARALASAFLIISLYTPEVASDLRLKMRLDLMKDSLLDYIRLRDVAISYLKAFDTGRINDKMKNGLIPHLQKLRPDILKKMQEKYNSEDMEDMEYNPEWEEMLRKSGLEKKMRELSELQSDGADIMMLPLSNLRQLPFFNRMSNWFLPFSKDHSQLRFLKDFGSSTVEVLLNANKALCDSDRFSLALSLERMPEAGRKMLMTQLDANISQLNEEMKEKMLKEESPSFRTAVDNYMRDLYRFFSLYRKRNDFGNPFEVSPNRFLELNLFSEWLNEKEMASMLSEFYFKGGYYKEALSIFERMSASEADDATLWEKIGYCRQSLADPAGALEAYRRAELLNPENPWLENMMAICSKTVGNYADSARYYGKMLERDPENVRAICNFAHANIIAGHLDEASKYLYKADYLDGDNAVVQRLLALCEMLSGKLDKSRTRVERILLTFDNEKMKINYLYVALHYILARDYKSAMAHLANYNPDPDVAVRDALAELSTLNLASRFSKDLRLLAEIMRHLLRK